MLQAYTAAEFRDYYIDYLGEVPSRENKKIHDILGGRYSFEISYFCFSSFMKTTKP
jgi:hypothetical protein